MSQRTSEIEDYVKRLGKLIISINTRLTEMEGKIADMEDRLAKLKAEQTGNANAIAEAKANMVQRAEFDEFVNSLTESLRDLLPAETAEAPKTETP